MAITSGFFNSINGDRKYNARQIGRYLGSLVSSGVFPNPSTNLQVLAGEGMAIQVSPGKAFIDCHWLENDSVCTIILDDADMVLDRIDAAVMRLDESDDARSVDIVVKKGEPSSDPQPPQMVREDKVQEYCLATIRVRKMKDDGAQEIVQADIADTRADTEVCGWVTGLIDQVDTHTLFLQWQDAYGRFYADSEAEFNAWLEGIREQFGEDIAGGALAKIQSLERDKADKASVFQKTLQATGWQGEDAPFTCALSVDGVTESSIVDISLSSAATQEQAKAWMAGQFADGGQEAGKVTVKAFGSKPEADIPVTVIVRGDA